MPCAVLPVALLLFVNPYPSELHTTNFVLFLCKIIARGCLPLAIAIQSYFFERYSENQLSFFSNSSIFPCASVLPNERANLYNSRASRLVSFFLRGAK
jgi:hypothetical protein